MAAVDLQLCCGFDLVVAVSFLQVVDDSHICSCLNDSENSHLNFIICMNRNGSFLRRMEGTLIFYNQRKLLKSN